MKKILVFGLCVFIIAGCGKKQSPVQQMQKPPVSSETQIIQTTKTQPNITSSKSLYPSRKEEQKVTPEWIKKLVSIHNQQYQQWQEKSSTETSSVLIASLISSSVVPSSPSPTSSPSIPASGGSVSQPYSPIIRQPQAMPSLSTASGSPSSGIISTAMAGSSSGTTPQPGSGGTNPPQDQQPPSPETPPEQPQQSSGVSVTRSIQSSSGSAYVRLDVKVTDNRVNGIIVSENIPDGYQLMNSSPAISKRVGNTVKWLFYGTSLTDQLITYEIKGTGKATISGSFSSSTGSGTITGDSQIGQ